MQPAAAALPAAFIERMPIGVLSFANEHLVAVNPAAVRLLGRGWPGGTPRTTVLGELGEGCSGLAGLREGTRMVAVAGTRLVEVERQDIDGVEHWFLHDVSTELRLLGQLAEQASALAYSHDAFVVLDQHGVVRYANEFAERERGVGPGGLVGQQLAAIERLCGPGFEEPRAQTAAEVAARLGQAIAKGETLRYPAWHRRCGLPGSSELPVEATLRPHRTSGETVLLMVARDESRRLMHVQALQEAKAQAESSDRAKSAFLAITSHELRTPLTGIIGFCELLQLEIGGGTNRQAEQYLGLIANSSKSLLAIINDILDLSKIEARTLEIRIATCDAGAIADQVCAGWRDRAKAKGIEMVRIPGQGKTARFTTDEQRLRQILENLVSNAVKFTERGRVGLAVDWGEDWVEFAVADEGAGIPEAARPHLFKAFWQAAAHTTRAAGGNGLGLYIARNIAELLGGRIWLASSGADGSVFRVRLPLVGPSKTSSRIMKSDIWRVEPPKT